MRHQKLELSAEIYSMAQLTTLFWFSFWSYKQDALFHLAYLIHFALRTLLGKPFISIF